MNKKKIGCVIAYRKNHTNYGTALVGYALLQKIRQLGFDVEVINYIKRPTLTQKVAWVVNAFRCGMGGSVIALFREKGNLKNNPSYAEGIKQRTEAVETYKDEKLIPLFKNYVGYEALHEGSKNYGTVVVGSDQVWTPMGLPTKFFNLLFVDDSVRKVAYASSFGVSEIPSFQKKRTGAYLDRFYRIGVREQRGKEIVDTLSHQIGQVVADPTLLLNADEWSEEIKDSRVNVDVPYIFCYFLGSNMEGRNAAEELKRKTGFKIITLRHMDEYVPEDEHFGDEAPYRVNPNDFLTYIKNAAYICTDSFHCTAFSIQFHKKFMTFYRFKIGSNTGRNSRIYSLFNVLGVNKEHIYCGNIDNINAAIDWRLVDKNLSDLRRESIIFLEKALG